MKTTRNEQRTKIISYIYSYLVMDKKLDSIDAFEIGDYSDKEIKIIEVIAKNFDSYQKVVAKFLKSSWSWERVNPLEQSILIYGAFELNVSDKALVINELVKITKEYIPGEAFKLINGILDKVGDFYNESRIKSN